MTAHDCFWLLMRQPFHPALWAALQRFETIGIRAGGCLLKKAASDVARCLSYAPQGVELIHGQAARTPCIMEPPY